MLTYQGYILTQYYEVSNMKNTALLVFNYMLISHFVVVQYLFLSLAFYLLHLFSCFTFGENITVVEEDQWSFKREQCPLNNMNSKPERNITLGNTTCELIYSKSHKFVIAELVCVIL